MRTRFRVALLGVAAASLATPAVAGPVVDAAAQAAEGWLGLVDAGAYAKSWQAAGAFFQANLSNDAWTLQVQRLRRELGPVRARGLTSETSSGSMPGAPDGDWETLQFSTSFARRAGVTETVLLLKQPGGWRVEGYGVQ